MFDFINSLTVILFYVVGLGAAGHILLHKEDPRAALGWIAVVLGIPIIGILLYVMFGLNRISSIAKQWEDSGFWNFDQDEGAVYFQEDVSSALESSLEYLIHQITEAPLLPRMQVDMLVNGQEAYPAMLQAINAAEHYVYLSSYIFSTRGIGYQFVEALVHAKARGVEVKILIDGVGCLYSFPTVYRLLKYKKISVALFLPPFRGWYHTLHLNLRNHRKLLIVDDQVAFTGGMNIRRQYLSKREGEEPRIRDLHFKIQGPFLRALSAVFARDWFFATGESLKPVTENRMTMSTESMGEALVRVIPSGPNQSRDALALVLKGLFLAAQRSIRIMTPYFILDTTLVILMRLAVLRGVNIEVILPEKNNLFFMKAASESLLPTLLGYGVKVYYRPGCFAHSKLVIVDHETAFLGSANWDTRSLYLNFELTLQVKQSHFLEQVTQHFESVMAESKLVSIQDLQSQTIVIKLRNAFFRLFSPYL